MSAYHKKGYTPVPIDTSDVQLPEELLELAEQLAENVHDIFKKLLYEQISGIAV